MRHQSGSRVVITGGTRGIGRALALAYRARGADVLVCGARPEGVRLLHEEHGVDGLCCDVTEAEDVAALADEVALRLGGVDVLIHCAAIQREVDITGEVDIAELEREVAINLLGPIRVTQGLLKLLLTSPSPSVVNVTSVLALTPKRVAPVYCATKAALSSWTTSLRYQLAPRGVHVMELVPPLVATDMAQGRLAGAIAPEEVARACIAGIDARRPIVRVGKAALAHVIHRLAPAVLARSLRDS
ncbi:MAG: SDR family NAD(P)-dependent oxidoreductase [Myxococcales bacterium]|nr:SDR family NAD(P)-dependent oxidoreductase [Myxococcales bacterium]